MATGKPGYAPSAAAVIGAYAAALDQLWEVPLELWRTVTETAYLEDVKLKRRATTVFLRAADVFSRTGVVAPDLQVSAERLALDGGPATRVDKVKIESTTLVAARSGGSAVAEIKVSLSDTAPRGAYRLEFRAAGWPAPEIRIVNFGV